MRYYRPAVLAMFYNQPEKYSIQTDEFEGTVRIRDGYNRQFAEDSLDRTYLNVAFGFRACKNGDWAIAAYAPDLTRATPDEQQLWIGFEIVGEEEFANPEMDDPRFRKWVSRYIMGNWDIEDGPIATLDRLVKQVNAITECVVRAPLFAVTDLRRLCFPFAQNTHRYEDAHVEVYRLIIDGLDKEAITGIGDKLGIAIKAGDKWTLTALEMLFPSEPVREAVRRPLHFVSELRRRASHRERPLAQSFPAFEEFEKDIRAVISGLETVRDELAERLDVNIERCEKRASAMRALPVFDDSRPTQRNYGIFPAINMVGRRVESVRTGELLPAPERPGMEAIVVEFSDGSIMSIETATNISQISENYVPIGPQELHVTFYVNFVPPMLPFRE